MHAGVPAEIHQPVTDQLEHRNGILGVGLSIEAKPYKARYHLGAHPHARRDTCDLPKFSRLLAELHSSCSPIATQEDHRRAIET
jgi:hypothetical protein